jgi:hypothetical protein
MTLSHRASFARRLACPGCSQRPIRFTYIKRRSYICTYILNHSSSREPAICICQCAATFVSAPLCCCYCCYCSSYRGQSSQQRRQVSSLICPIVQLWGTQHLTAAQLHAHKESTPPSSSHPIAILDRNRTFASLTNSMILQNTTKINSDQYGEHLCSL